MSSSTEITGANLIAGESRADGNHLFNADNRLSGHSLGPEFHSATHAEVLAAVTAAAEAAEAFESFGRLGRADLLEAIAAGLENNRETLVQRANMETALPEGRLTGEVGRTTGQLRMFAALLRDGSYVDARLDRADPERKPAPKPDLRRMLRPVGPVGVFGASNFPFAFSAPGGDTASALAAGCPVVVKAHPAHPGTSALCGQAICEAIEKVGAPSGAFSMVHGRVDVGLWLVEAPELQAVGFTGSLRAGRALFESASRRARPIPVFAEMGSVNPIFVCPGAVAEDPAKLAKGYAASLTLGVGQFCTNPGLILGVGEPFKQFLALVARELESAVPGIMLTQAIAEHFHSAVKKRVECGSGNLYVGESKDGRVAPSLFQISGKEFMEEKHWAEEVFGPQGVAIVCDDAEELIHIASTLEGQLTATIHATDADQELAGRLATHLTRVAGRVVWNGFPTGVEVGPAMQHGGPYPATTDSRSTSVGTAAIFRFLRPVSYQDFPEALLPDELKTANPGHIARLVDGKPASD